MAQLSYQFDATQYEAPSEYQPLPAGKYIFQAIASDYKSTKSGTGKFAEYELEVLEGPPDTVGRKHFERFNLENDNAQAVEIGQKQFKVFAEACGQPLVNDTSDLEFMPVFGEVRLKQRKDRPGSYENTVTYKPTSEYGGQAPAPAGRPAPAPAAPRPAPAAPAQPRQQAAAPAAAPAPRPAAGGGAKPWERHKRSA